MRGRVVGRGLMRSMDRIRRWVGVQVLWFLGIVGDRGFGKWVLEEKGGREGFWKKREFGGWWDVGFGV